MRRAPLKTANCSSYADPARAVAWQRKPWRTSAIDEAGMWRTVSRGLSTPIAIEGGSPVGRRPVLLGCRVSAPVTGRPELSSIAQPRRRKATMELCPGDFEVQVKQVQ